MYLYRNFGQRMEAYFAKKPSIDDSEDTDSVDQEPSLNQRAKDRPGLLLKSESEDSGVEEAVATPLGSVEGFSLGKDSDMADGSLSPSSPPSPSPALAPSFSSPPNLKGRDGWHRLCTQVELALRRTKQRSPGAQRKANQRPPRLPIDSTVFQAPSCPRLEEEAPEWPAAEPCQQSQGRSEVDAQVCGETGDPCDKLSPGLSYLEEVCRLLEEIARLQTRNRELRRERDGFQYQLREKEAQELMSRPCLCGAAETTNEGPEPGLSGHMSSGPAPWDPSLSLPFRRRSVSESEVLRRNLEQWKVQQGYGSAMQLTEVDSGKRTKARQDRAKWQAVSLKETSRGRTDPREESNKEPISPQKPLAGQKKSRPQFGPLFKRRSKNKTVR